MNSAVPSHIAELPKYEPGKPTEEVERELGISDVLKMASNENPLGPSPKAIAEIRAHAEELAIYPDGGAHALRNAIARKLSLAGAAGCEVAADEICVGNGSSELIDCLVRTFTVPGDEVLSFRYSFIMYPLVTRAHGATFVEAPVGANFEYDVDALLSAVTTKTRLVFVANPNNPTGTTLSAAGMVRILTELPPHIVLAVDEAYREYVTEPGFPELLALRRRRERVIVLRTFSKAFGLAGLRVGYGYGNRELVGYLDRVRLPFNVSSLSQRAAIAALGDDEHVARSRETNAAASNELLLALKECGLRAWPSQGNFVLCDVARSGREVFEKLLLRGVIVRPLGGYGLANHVRITVGKQEQNVRLVAALRAIISENAK